MGIKFLGVVLMEFTDIIVLIESDEINDHERFSNRHTMSPKFVPLQACNDVYEYIIELGFSKLEID